MSGAILGIDVGSVRIGVAIAEDLTLPALPLATLDAASRSAGVAAVAALARERSANTIVVGYPLRLDGTGGPAAAKVDKFIDALRPLFDGRIERVDERMSTAAAHAKLRESSGLTARGRRHVVDRVAAVEILDSFLNAKRRDV